MDAETRRRLIAKYREGPAEVDRALDGITDDELDFRIAEGEWTPREVVHHLADSEMTSAIRIRRLIAEDEPVLARNMLVNIPHAQNPDFRMVGSPVKLSDTPVEYKRPAPMLGEHTDEVLSTRLGLSAEALELLKDKGIIEQLK